MRTVGPGFDYFARLDQADDIRGLCLTRDKMDSAMVDAARSIECVAMREKFRVTDVIIEDGAIAGIRGEDSSGAHVFRRAAGDWRRWAAQHLRETRIRKNRRIRTQGCEVRARLLLRIFRRCAARKT